MGGAQEGFPTVIILILTLGSMILLGLGIIGEYLAEIYAEVKGRPHLVLRETIGWKSQRGAREVAPPNGRHGGDPSSDPKRC